MKHLISIAALLLATFGATTVAQADYLDANVSSDSARLGYGLTLREAETSLVLEASYLYADEYEEANTNVAALGLMVSGDAGASSWQLKAGLGGRAYFADLDDISGGGLGLGGEFSFRFPTFNRVGVSGRLYYAPEVLAFNDLDSLLDAAIQLDYEVLRNAYVYVGARLTRSEIEDIDDDVNLEQGAHVGLRIVF